MANFDKALQLLREDKRVTRESWEHVYITATSFEGTFNLMKYSDTGYVGYTIDAEDLFATDWIEYDAVIECTSRLKPTDIKRKAYYIRPSTSTISDIDVSSYNNDNASRVLSHTAERAEQLLALTELLRYADYYNNGWKPISNKLFYGITRDLEEGFTVERRYKVTSAICFPTEEQANNFLLHYKDLIEKCKELL